MVQRPNDLDTACSLALLQEEVAEGDPNLANYHYDHKIVRIPAKNFPIRTQAFQQKMGKTLNPRNRTHTATIMMRRSKHYEISEKPRVCALNVARDGAVTIFVPLQFRCT
jgi:hypothetical protein